MAASWVPAARREPGPRSGRGPAATRQRWRQSGRDASYPLLRKGVRGVSRGGNLPSVRLTLSLLGAMICAAVLNAQVNPVPRLPAKPYPPAPRLADGTPNLGPTEPTKGYWHVTQFQDY